LGKTPQFYIDEINRPKGKYDGSVLFQPSPLTRQLTSYAVSTSLESRIETPGPVPPEALENFQNKAHTLAAQWEEDVQRANGRGSDPKRSGPSCIYDDIIRPQNYIERMRANKEPTPFKQTPSSVQAARHSSRNRVSSQKVATGGSTYYSSQAATGSQLQTTTQPARVNLKLDSQAENVYGFGTTQSRQQTPNVSLNIPGTGPTTSLSVGKGSLTGTSHPSGFPVPSATVSVGNSSSVLTANGGDKKLSRSGSGATSVAASRKRAAPESAPQPPPSSPAGTAKKRKQSRSKGSNRGRGGSNQSSRGFPDGGPQAPFTPETSAQESALQSMPNAGSAYQQWLANLLQDEELRPKIIEASNDPTLDDDAKAARIEQVVKEHTRNR
jgi:hypothetical protein